SRAVLGQNFLGITLPVIGVFEIVGFIQRSAAIVMLPRENHVMPGVLAKKQVWNFEVHIRIDAEIEIIVSLLTASVMADKKVMYHCPACHGFGIIIDILSIFELVLDVDPVCLLAS